MRPRSRWLPLLVSLALIATPLAAGAQLTVGTTLLEGSPPNLSPVSPAPTSSASICTSVDVPFTWGLVSIQLDAGSDYSLDVGLEFADTPQEVLETIIANLGDAPSILPCGITIVEDYGHVYGAISLYSFAIGGGFSGGNKFTRKATSSLAFRDVFQITSDVAQGIELPLSIAADIFAAESFGDPAETFGRVSLTLIGDFGGTPVAESGTVESVSVIPEQFAVGASRTLPVALAPGLNSFAIDLVATIDVETTATSAGLFGSISGAATAGATFPESIRIGRFRGQGGGPLPSGIAIRSLSRPGLVYECTRPGGCAAAPPDADADGVADAADNCPDAPNADQLDRGGLGTGSAPDGIGDACQCGDVTGDGSVTIADALNLVRSFLTPPTATLARPELCDVGGPPSPATGGCALSDAVLVRRALLSPPTAAVQQACAPATP
jgi:hypothetical protein